MELTVDSREHIEHVADETLGQFDKISESAKKKLRDENTLGPDALASINTMTSGSALQRLGQINQSNRESYKVLAAEPAIARVVVEDLEGEQRTYYICRTTPVSGFNNLASYRAPIGRLASLSVGSSFALPNGAIVEVVERAKLNPSLLADGWDSRNTVVEADSFRTVTIESLRDFLNEVAGEESAEDILGQLLNEESLKANIIQGVRRSVITKMGLRDQPILDQYQDEIFRLPLDQRLLILGPPGTGKTTTLIRRLGQKLDAEFLDDDERRLVERIGSTNGSSHANSWLMFTPTELLKQYLKEAFAREGVPASDLRIKTWHDYRRELAKNNFGVLRSASGGGIFVLKDTIDNLQGDAVNRPIEWFEDFDKWQSAVFVQELTEAALSLAERQEAEVRDLGNRLIDILGPAANTPLPITLEALASVIPSVQALVAGKKETTDAKIKNVLNLQLNRNRDFLDDLARYIDSLQQSTEGDDLEDQDSEEEDEVLTSKTGRAVAFNTFMQAVRAQARAVATKRSLSKNSRNGKIVEWLGDRTLAESDRAEVGASLVVQASARRFTNPVKRYLDGVSRRYRAYRRQSLEAGTWYIKGAFEPRDIHPLELDIVVMAILRAARDLLTRPIIMRNIDKPAWSVLNTVLELYQNQILVDEATDFSPIQLGCMAALTQPRIRSFFACGDFNQRLTVWGTRSTDDLKWVFPDIDIKEVTVTYRQSKQLNELARAIIHAVGGTDQNVSLPADVDSEGVPPALLETAPESQAVVDWLADRIREIESFVGQLPSTAIFVNTEAEVAPLAEALSESLAEHNIQVVACPQGQVMGQDNDVRVFDVQHIKGLEFEAVFFTGVDRLAALHPELFDKYLYVGTTRAATYLGITCEGVLPASIESVRSLFVADWESPAVATASASTH